MVYLATLALVALLSFASGYYVRHKRGVVLDIKKAVAGLAQLRDDGKVHADTANKLILLARDERRKAGKRGTN